MAGAAIAITDQVDTIGNNAHIFQNPEVLALRRAGLVGKPVFNNGHAFEYDPTSRDPERWIAQLPDGSWAVALFNRQDGPAAVARSIDFADVLGFTGPAAVRDLWAHEDLGSLASYQTTLGPTPRFCCRSCRKDRPIFRPMSAHGRVRRGSRTPLAATKEWATSRVSIPRGAAWRSPSRCRKPAAAESCAAWPTPRGVRPTDRPCARPGYGPPPRRSRPPGAEHVGLDRLADGAGDPDHGGRDEPCRVQRRVVRSGRGQSRLHRPGLRSALQPRSLARVFGLHHVQRRPALPAVHDKDGQWIEAPAV